MKHRPPLKFGISLRDALSYATSLGVTITPLGDKRERWSYPGLSSISFWSKASHTQCPGPVVKFLMAVSNRQDSLDHQPPSLQGGPTHLLTFSAGQAENPPPPCRLSLPEIQRLTAPLSPLANLLNRMGLLLSP